MLSKDVVDDGGHRAVQGHGRLIGTGEGVPFADSPVTPVSAARTIGFALGTTAMVHGGTWGVLDSADLAEPGTTRTLQLGW